MQYIIDSHFQLCRKLRALESDAAVVSSQQPFRLAGCKKVNLLINAQMD